MSGDQKVLKGSTSARLHPDPPYSADSIDMAMVNEYLARAADERRDVERYREAGAYLAKAGYDRPDGDVRQQVIDALDHRSAIQRRLEAALSLCGLDQEAIETCRSHGLEATSRPIAARDLIGGDVLRVSMKVIRLANLILNTCKLGTRWPCPECGRPSATDPLRSNHITQSDGQEVIMGCWFCTTGDRLVAAAEAALAVPTCKLCASWDSGTTASISQHWSCGSPIGRCTNNRSPFCGDFRGGHDDSCMAFAERSDDSSS